MDASISPAAALLLDFIASKEAPKGYNTVYGNKKMPKLLTAMTFDEVVADGPRRTREYGSSAAGRYQFMRDTLDTPKTLADIKGEMGLSGTEKFSPDLQDRMAMHLLVRRGWSRFISGKIGVIAFGLAIAKEWASFPVLRAVKGQKRQVQRGQSYYAGDGLNKSLVSADDVERVLNQCLALADAKPVAVPTSAPKPASVPALPEVQTVPAPLPIQPTSFLDKLRGHFKPKAVDPRPGLAANGDPELYDIQRALKRLAYEPIILDGLNGRLTRNAVYAAREQNGLPKSSKIDAEFKAALPGMKRAEVPAARAQATVAEAKAQAPDLFAALRGFNGIGSITAATAAVGGLADAGVFDQVKQTLQTVNETATTVNGGLSKAITFGQWLFEHWYLPVGVIGVVILFRVYVGYLRLKVLYQQSRAT